MIFQMTGIFSGISSGNYGFSGELDSLADNLNCPWILDGTIRLIIPGADYTSGTIDFISNDGCSNKMQYNFEGNIIYLRNNAQYLKN
jgi:hypothetical protein